MSKTSFIVLGLLLTTNISYALETDQFLASFHVIKDSSSVINNYFFKNINQALDSANSKRPENIKCTQLADDVLSNLVGKFSISKVSQFAKFSPDVDKFPDNSISDREYFKMTFYENSDILMKMAPLARTINLNGVYLGTDKLGHFSLLGRHYYRKYLKNIKNGMDQKSAETDAIVHGFNTEKGVLGYGLGGVLSYADLEANYEGFKFAKDMCEGEKPYFVFEKNRWELNKNAQFDIKNYFNPRMDESYNFSFWRPFLYKRIAEKLKKEYCEVRTTSMFQDRMAFYASLKLTENTNDKLIAKNLRSMEKFDRKMEDLNSSCN